MEEGRVTQRVRIKTGPKTTSKTSMNTNHAAHMQMVLKSPDSFLMAYLKDRVFKNNPKDIRDPMRVVPLEMIV